MARQRKLLGDLREPDSAEGLILRIGPVIGYDGHPVAELANEKGPGAEIIVLTLRNATGEMERYRCPPELQLTLKLAGVKPGDGREYGIEKEGDQYAIYELGPEIPEESSTPPSGGKPPGGGKPVESLEAGAPPPQASENAPQTASSKKWKAWKSQAGGDLVVESSDAREAELDRELGVEAAAERQPAPGLRREESDAGGSEVSHAG